MNIQVPLTERLGRLSQWAGRTNDRPLLGFFLDSQYPLHRYHCQDKLPAGRLTPEMIKVDIFLDEYDRLFDFHESCGGDLVWSASPFFGIPWVEASLGCGVYANHNTGATTTQSPDGFGSSLSVPVFSPDNPWIVKMREFISALEKRSGGRYPVGTTLMRGMSDLLAALYGQDQFVFRFFEAQAEVQKVVEQVCDHWVSFGRYLLSQLPLFHGGTGMFFYNIWSPGKMVYYQDDAAALLSPDLYKRFIFPSVLRIVESFPYSMVHLHPSQYVPIDLLMKTEFDIIELHRDIGGPRAEEMAHYYHAILAEKALLICGDLTEEDLDFILRNVSYQGLAIIYAVKTQQQCQAIWDRAMRIIGG